MKLILHIGMGKTGTSSIQNVLNKSKKKLADQKVHYLGIWFDVVNPAFAGYEGNENFFKYTLDSPFEAAQALLSRLNEIQKNTGSETFILSNESIFNNAKNCKDFIKVLHKYMDVRIIAYVRDPHEWLPSAYTQWRLNHKVHSGPIRPFSSEAHILMAAYDSFPLWHDMFNDIMDVRLHNSQIDVVKDFAETLRINLEDSSSRHLVRNEETEILLRAAFNTRKPGSVLPNQFNNEIVDTNRTIPSLSELAQLCFSNDGIDAAIEDRRTIFELMRDKLGPNFDFLSHVAAASKPHDMSEIRSRLLDFLVEISLSQADRIKKLEEQVKQLQTEARE